MIIRLQVLPLCPTPHLITILARLLLDTCHKKIWFPTPVLISVCECSSFFCYWWWFLFPPRPTRRTRTTNWKSIGFLDAVKVTSSTLSEVELNGESDHWSVDIIIFHSIKLSNGHLSHLLLLHSSIFHTPPSVALLLCVIICLLINLPLVAIDHA